MNTVPDRRGWRRRGAAALAAAALLYAGVRGGAWAVREYFYRHLQPPVLPPMEALRELGTLRGAQCGQCHAVIHAEWRGSLHGRAMTDRFFLAEYEAQRRLFACLRCHAPLTEQQPTLVTGFAGLGPPRPEERPNPRFDPALQEEGVTCVVCHQRDGAIVGPLPLRAAEVPHRTRVDARFASNGLCVRCHAAEAFPGARLEREVLPTFVEHAEYRARGGRSGCVECHFPSVERPLTASTPVRRGRSHRLWGPRDRDFVRAHVGVAGPVCRVEGARLGCVVALENRAGHRVPTGEPGRELLVVLRPEDGSPAGAAHLLRRMDRVDLVEGPGEDTTLRVGERRRVRVEAAAGAATLAVEFCLFEEGDVLLRATGTAYRSVCGTLGRWAVSPRGEVVERALPVEGPAE